MLITNRENRSVPAVAGTGFGSEDFSAEACDEMSVISSDTVEIDVDTCVIRSHSALIAAIGWGSDGVD